MAVKFSNFARMTLVQAVTAAATTLFVSADDGDLLPMLSPGDTAPAILFDATNKEIVYITAESAGELTVTRGQEGTVARDWPSGTVIIHTLTASFVQTAVNLALAADQFHGTATNVGNAYTVDVGAGNSIPALTGGERVTFQIPADNTGAITVDVTNGVTSTGAKSVTHQDGRALQDGDFQEDWVAEVIYDLATDTWLLVSETSFNLHAVRLNDGPIPAVSRHPNSRFDAWNGGTTFNTPASLTETADDVYPEYDGTIGTFTINRQSFTLGQTDVPGDPKHFLRWDQSSAGSGSTLRRIRIPLPGVHWRAGETVTRSVWMKADAARNVTAKLIQHFGTGGAPSADVAADSDVCALTASWQRFDITTTLPSIAGKTLGSNGDDALVLTLDLPLNVSMTIDVANDDFRSGDVAGDHSDTFPLPTWLGGTGGSFSSLTDIASFMTNVVHTTGNETVAGEKTFTSNLILSAAEPRLRLFESDQAANEKLWDLSVSGGDLLVRTRTDVDGAGVNALTFDRGVGTAITKAVFGTVVEVPLGSAAAPALFFTGHPTDGFYHGASAGQVFVTCGGAFTILFTADPAIDCLNSQLRVVSGSAATPSIADRTNTDLGIYFPADAIAFSVNNSLKADLTASRLQMATGVDIVLPTTAHAPTSAFSAGYRGAPVVSGNSAYAFPAAEAGHTVYHDEASARTYTIPANASVAHQIGTVFVIDNTGNSGAAGTITLQITSDTLRRGDGVAGTGSRSILANSVAVIRKSKATEWVITGTFT